MGSPPCSNDRRLGPEIAAQPGLGSPKRLGCLAGFIRHTFVQIRADDHLVHQTIGAGRQTISHASIYVEAPDLEIDYRINVVLLLVEGQPALQRAEIGVILDPDRQILAEIAREARSRRENRSPVLSKPDVHDGVEDELVIALAPTDNGPDLHVPLRRIAAWRS